MDLLTDLQAETAHLILHTILDLTTETTATPAIMTHTTDKGYNRDNNRNVITVLKQVEQEPKPLQVHPVHVKTQTLNIAENTTHKHSSRENKATRDQYI